MKQPEMEESTIIRCGQDYLDTSFRPVIKKAELTELSESYFDIWQIPTKGKPAPTMQPDLVAAVWLPNPNVETIMDNPEVPVIAAARLVGSGAPTIYEGCWYVGSLPDKTILQLRKEAAYMLTLAAVEAAAFGPRTLEEGIGYLREILPTGYVISAS